jgi:Molybdopterin-binding domain of aldehyde dehydrogenase.
LCEADGCVFSPREVLAVPDENKSIPLNAWVRIVSDNTVTIVSSQAEVGQGIQTTAVLAEELGIDWSQVPGMSISSR